MSVIPIHFPLRGLVREFSSFCSAQGLYRYNIPSIRMLEILSPQVDRNPMTSLLLDEVGTTSGGSSYIAVVRLIVVVDT